MKFLFVFWIIFLMAINSFSNEYYFSIPPNEALGKMPWISIDIYVTGKPKTMVYFEYLKDSIKLYKIIDKSGVCIFSTNNPGEIKFNWENRDYLYPSRSTIHIISSDTIGVYLFSCKQYSAEALTLYPTNQLGNHYFHLGYYEFSELPVGDKSGWYERGTGFIITAIENSTHCKIYLRGTPNTYLWSYYKIGDTVDVYLNKGDSYYITTNHKTLGIADLTGTEIISNNNIGIISCNDRTKIPASNSKDGRNPLYEQLPPINSLNTDYITLEFLRKGRGDYFRILATEDSTYWNLISYDKNKNIIDTLSGFLKNKGDFKELYNFNLDIIQPTFKSIRGITLWHANKPIMLAQYSYSAAFDNSLEYDPFMIIIPPTFNYIDQCIFQIPTYNQTFVNNYINLIILGDTLDINQTLLKTVEIDNKLLYKLDSTILNNNIIGTNYYWFTYKIDTGRHEIKSNTKLMGIIYGFGELNAYGYTLSSKLFTYSKLIANSFDWQRKKIYRPGFKDVGPYSVSGVINLKNQGTKILKIDSVNINNYIGSTDVFDTNLIKKRICNLLILPGNDTIIPVLFNPLDTEYYKLILSYYSDANNNDTVITILEGKGVVPLIESKDYNFDTTIVNNFNFPNLKMVSIKNIKYNWDDTVSIYDFFLSQQKGWNFYKNNIFLPIKILPGDSLIIPAYFTALKPYSDSVIFYTETNALKNTQNIWYGYGIINKLNITSYCVSSCFETKKELYCFYENLGTEDIIITNLEIVDDIENFKLDSIKLPLIIKPNEKIKIIIFFKSVSLGSYSARLITTIDSLIKYETNIYGKTTQNQILFKLNILNDNPNIGDKLSIYIDDYIISNSNYIIFDTIHFEILYNFGFLNFDTISINNLFVNKYFINNLRFDLNSVKFDFISINKMDTLFNTPNLINIVFNTLLPNSDSLSMEVKLNVLNYNPCNDIKTINTIVNYKPICGFDIRKIKISSEYWLDIDQYINKHETVTININILNDEHVELSIYDLNGGKLLTIDNSILKKGIYTYYINLNNLSTGIYVCQLKTDNFFEIKKIILLP